VEKIAGWVSIARVQHGDETGIRIGGTSIGCMCTAPLARPFGWHQKRGRQAMDEIAIWHRFEGLAMHDRWASDDRYAGTHSLCGAHLVRDCLNLAEQEWAAAMADHLLAMYHVAQQWHMDGAGCVPRLERDEWVAHYFDILARICVPPSLLSIQKLSPVVDGKSRAPPQTCSIICCTGLIRCWPFSTT
jgi:transposase